MTHPEPDTLATIAATLDWRPIEQVQHLHSCDRCRAELRKLSHVHEAMDHAIEPREGFADEVMSVLPADDTRSPVWHMLPTLIAPTLAALTSFAALASTSGGRSPSEWLLPALAMAVLAGIATAAWSAREARRAEPDPV